MFGTIRRNPSLRFGLLMRALTLSEGREARSSAREVNFGYARFALQRLLIELGLDPQAEVLIPAYTCDVVLLAVQQAKLNAVFYGVSRHLGVDFSSIKLSKNTKVLITTNYFGFSRGIEDIQRFAESNGLVWINDNSHGFAGKHGEKPLHEFGDFSITSFRKTLPTVNGATLAINNPGYEHLMTKLRRHDATAKWDPRVARFPLASLAGLLRYKPGTFPNYAIPSSKDETNLMPYRVDPFSARIMASASVDQVRSQRIAIYRRLDRYIMSRLHAPNELVADLFHDGNAPMAYPLLFRDEDTRNAILGSARKCGVDVHTWPDLPQSVREKDIFGAYSQWKHLALLPLHQDMDADGYCGRLDQIFSSC